MRLIQKISDIYKYTRLWFYKNNFIEVRTNILTQSPGWDAYFIPFSTKYIYNNKVSDFYLSSSPEFEMKALFSKNINRFFQITKSFRNSEFDKTHSPEFNMLEWYKNNSNYIDAMKDTENLFYFVIKKVLKKKYIKYNNRKFLIKKNIEKIKVSDIFYEKTGIDLKKVQDKNIFLEEAYSKGFTHINKDASWDTIFFIIFLEKVEKEIINIDYPVFLIDYPVQIASLAKKNKNNPEFVERFELYAGSLELCNGYSELLNKKEHFKRLENINKIRRKNGLNELKFPEELNLFFNSEVKNVSGVAFGMDRFCMFITGCDDIFNIIPFNIYLNS